MKPEDVSTEDHLTTKPAAGIPGVAAPEISPLANAASAAAAKIVHHPRWPRMAADAHALATKIIVAEMETMLREAWREPSVLRTHVLRYGPPGYDITRGWNTVETLGVDGEGVLVTDGNEYAVAARHCDEWFECATERPLTFAPTHWMDLPDFPSESNTKLSNSGG